MNLQDIEAFVAVAETGSVNRAAVRLNLTQPATTRRIQNFEASIGDAPLFNRSVKPAALTALGLHVFEHCRRVLAAIAELQAITTSASDPTGDLKIGVAHGLGGLVMTTPLDALRRRFPRLRLQVSSNWTAGLIEGVRSGALDCAVGLLTEAHSVPSGTLRVALGPEQVVVVAPRAGSRPEGTPWRLRDLADDGWVLNPAGCGCRTALVKAFDRQKLPIQIAAEVFGEELQLALIAHSGGLGLVPRRQFDHSPHRPALQMLDVLDFSLPTEVSLIRSADPRRFDPVTTLLVEALKESLS